MKKLIFLLIPLLLTSLVSSCTPVTNDSETVKQKTLRQIEDAKARARQKLTPQKQRELREFWKTRRAEQRAEYAKAEQIEQERALAEEARVEALRKQQKLEQEAKYKRFKEECVEFIQNEDGSLKNKTTQEVKKLVDQWNYYWTDHLIERMGQEWVIQNAEEVSNLEIFYKIFGNPWKTQFMGDSYVLWYICKGGNALITVSVYAYDNGWINILDLNIL